MRPEDFERLYKLEGNYWWFVAMRHITDTVVATKLQEPNLRILDAGCGTGYNLDHYSSRDSREVYGLDIADAALEGVRRRGFKKVVQASITEIPFQPDTFDLVFSFEVVTQLPYERHDAALREIYRVLKPGGYLFIRVPAFMWLWSSHDDELEVFYRYQREELSGKLIRVGFAIEWASYANGFLFPVILLRRSIKHLGIGKGTDVKALPRGLGWLDPVLRGILEREAKWFKSRKRLPFGLSLICYAQKPEATV
jgi:SAM-dependent methyltransferase